MPKDIGQITGMDEMLCHQMANTFAVAGQSDLGFTEKIWTTFARKDGSLQCDFGIGRYPNRNVVDGFAGIARGTEQWTVRASRRVDEDIERIGVGPMDYRIEAPLHSVTVSLGTNAILPISFDLTFLAELPPFFEDRDFAVERGRVVTDVVRWHQGGTVEGRIHLDGQDIEVSPEDWFAFRDRSWGVRQYVGAAPSDLPPSDRETFMTNLQMHWSPSILRRSDGSSYELHYYFRDSGSQRTHLTSHLNDSDGSQRRITTVNSAIRYDEHTRDTIGGTLRATLADGTTQRFLVEPVSATGFRLNPALYFGWKDMYHGTYKGDDHLDGEYIANCGTERDGTAEPAWQLRDRIIRVSEIDGDASGYGILESMLIGDWPDLTDGPDHDANVRGTR